MPPLLGLTPTPSPSLVPVVDIQRKRDKGKAPVRLPPRREYTDEPLPVRPNTIAPKSAHIIGREQEHDGGLVGYTLKIGDVEINDVGVDEILEYVSALELEQFEMVRFREEAKILKVLEEDREAKRKAKSARAAERARTKGAVFVEEGSDSDGLAASVESDEQTEVQLGKHGRARPDYSRFYKPPRGTGAKIYEDFVDQDMADNDEPSASRTGAHQHVQKRRRRKRDPITGELMPLAPSTPEPPLQLEKQVRKRRKRHPLTGELMHIGWQYDPEAEKEAYERRRMGIGGPQYASASQEPSFKRLSISEHHEAKRPRLDTESANSSSASPIPTKAQIMGQAAFQSTPRAGGHKAPIVDLLSSDDDLDVVARTPKASLKSQPKQAGNSMMRGTIGSVASMSGDDGSPDPVSATSIVRPTAASPSASQRTPKAQQPAKTSILSPSAARATSTRTPSVASEDGASDEDAEEGEWFIESIMGHCMSDPKTHPPELGKEPVMLYSVKWEGFDSPTWEPMDSFGDRSFVYAYRKKVGLKPLPKDDDDDDDDDDENDEAEEETDDSTVRIARIKTAAPASASKTSADEEEVYELEKIVSHYLSNPRTHPNSLGKIPVMLYQVKWKGWSETTWEPEESFDDDPKPLHEYKRKHGLR